MTRKQRGVLDFIAAYTTRNGHCPTITLNLPADLAFALRHAAAQAGVTKEALVTDILLDAFPCPQKRDGSA